MKKRTNKTRPTALQAEEFAKAVQSVRRTKEQSLEKWKVKSPVTSL
ncbi:hypothetical protein V8094_000291 [Vibrio parahaemolyticus]|nr:MULTISPECIES: hypothetical protein [Vibrio]MDW2256865.1 hypothetical protein [Vibrio sp. 1409]EJG2227911.1 hypothetical protein [Vibrio parahaemolyticus]MBE4315429.1 hypothetical protein [Vibrio parahaemolyticus]MCA2467158.1 hypothetical protein [Vibrio alginolyticus]MCA6718231.1 hypothetical protein [Vibrio alginolyticus]